MILESRFSKANRVKIFGLFRKSNDNHTPETITIKMKVAGPEKKFPPFLPMYESLRTSREILKEVRKNTKKAAILEK